MNLTTAEQIMRLLDCGFDCLTRDSPTGECMLVKFCDGKICCVFPADTSVYFWTAQCRKGAVQYSRYICIVPADQNTEIGMMLTHESAGTYAKLPENAVLATWLSNSKTAQVIKFSGHNTWELFKGTSK